MFELYLMVFGFEMLLCFFFLIWDMFGLYGCLGWLCVSFRDLCFFMFVMLKYKKYGYFELFDVSGFIIIDGSFFWLEREWCKKLKELMGICMLDMEVVGDIVS